MGNVNFSSVQAGRQFAPLAVLTAALCSIYPHMAAAQANVGPTGTNTQQAEEIVVSASRIERGGFTAPTPTTVVGSEEFKARSAVTVSDVLYDLPSSRPSTNGLGTSRVGISTVNLRGLNANQNSRTLFLVDGHRVVASNQYGQIDSNIVPSSMIERLETVTGGASAAWGSDAVAGVVNVIFKKKIQGFEGNIQYGQSQRNDNKSRSGSLAWGTDFADGRGQVMVAGEYSKSYDPPTYADRSWANQHTAFVTRTINGITYTNVAASGLQRIGLTNGGVISGINSSLTTLNGAQIPANSPLRGIQFGPGGVPIPFSYTTDPGAVSTTYGVGGDGGWVVDKTPMSAPTERSNIYARATFDLTSSISAFAEASHSQVKINATQAPISSPGGSVGAQQIVVSRTNPYLIGLTQPLPTNGLTLLQTMINANIQTISIGRISPDLGTFQTFNTTKTDRFVAGLDGTFGSTGRWSAYATHGKSTSDVKAPNNIIEANYRAALDPIVVNGQIVCDPAVVALYGASPGCVPANPFGSGSFSQAVKNYVTGTLTNFVTNKQDAGGASVQGEPFSTWAGPVSLAGGVEYRRESLSSYVDPISDLPPSGTNGRPALKYGVSISGGYENANPKTIPEVSYIVREVFAETVVPLLAKMPFAKSLDLNAAIRDTDYSTSGKVKSWKLGLTYVPVNDFLLRTTRSHDIRGPSLAELFQGANVTAGNIAAGNDYEQPTATYSYAAIAAGNPKLVPETAETLTGGFTWTPSAVKGLNASVDYYQIKLKNGIDVYGTQNIIDSCYGKGLFAGNSPNPSSCSLITRAAGPGTNITLINNSNVNIGLRKTTGIDFELGYHFPLNQFFQGLPGVLDLRALSTYTITDVTTTFVGSTPTEAVGVGDPRVRLTLSSTYQNGPLTLNLQGKYTDSVRYSNTPINTATTQQYLSNNIPSYFVINSSIQYTIYDSAEKGRLQVYGNINNLLDRTPPILYNTATPSSATFYDLIGRAFTVGLRFSY